MTAGLATCGAERDDWGLACVSGDFAGLTEVEPAKCVLPPEPQREGSVAGLARGETEQGRREASDATARGAHSSRWSEAASAIA